VTETIGWVDSPALQPGGGLALERRGVLGPFDVVRGRLALGESGVHRFALAGTLGVTLQAKVATDNFEPVVIVIAPSGARWDLSSRARAPDAGGQSSVPGGDLVLPEPGDYVLLLTSRENVTAGRAVTTGEYRLTLLCDAPRKPTSVIPKAPSSRSGRFSAWESEPR